MKKLVTGVLGGITGSILMSLVMVLEGTLGLPELSPAKMLSRMMGWPISTGWVMHFMIGILFGLAYIYIADKILKIGNTWLKGTLFGTIIYLFAMIVMTVLPVPPMAGTMLLIIIGSLISHIIYGITVVLTAGNVHCSKEFC